MCRMFHTSGLFEWTVQSGMSGGAVEKTNKTPENVGKSKNSSRLNPENPGNFSGD